MGSLHEDGSLKEKKKEASLCAPLFGVLKFNVAGEARGKPSSAGIGSALRNYKGEVLHIFSKHVGIKDSNEAEVLAILEALHIYRSSCKESLIVESGYFNAISWVKSCKGPWKMKFYFNEIHYQASSSQVSFQHVSRPANGMTVYFYFFQSKGRSFM